MRDFEGKNSVNKVCIWILNREFENKLEIDESFWFSFCLSILIFSPSFWTNLKFFADMLKKWEHKCWRASKQNTRFSVNDCFQEKNPLKKVVTFWPHQVNFTWSARDSSACAEIKGGRGSKSFPVAAGKETEVIVVCSSQDGSNNKHYVIKVTRMSASDALLSSLKSVMKKSWNQIFGQLALELSPPHYHFRTKKIGNRGTRTWHQ